MERVFNRYKEVYKDLLHLQEFQCIYANEGLEKIASSEDIDEFIALGLYNPDEGPSVEHVIEIQTRMYEATSQLRVLYKLLNQEDPPLASQIHKLQETVDRVHDELKALFLEKHILQGIKPSDIQESILDIFDDVGA